jgi:hypothetical protein
MSDARARLAAVTFCLAATAGCHTGGKTTDRVHETTDTRVDASPGLFEVTETAEEFKNKLAAFRFPERIVQLAEDGKPVIQLLSIRNETDEHFDTHILTDKVREVVTDTQKAVFTAETENLPDLARAQQAQAVGGVDPREKVEDGRAAGARYALLGRLKNIRKSNGEVTENTIIFTLELDDLERRIAVLIASKEFRLTKS